MFDLVGEISNVIHDNNRKKKPYFKNLVSALKLIIDQDYNGAARALPPLFDQCEGEPEYFLARLFIDNKIPERSGVAPKDLLRRSNNKQFYNSGSFIAASMMLGVNGETKDVNGASDILRGLARRSDVGGRSAFYLGKIYKEGADKSIAKDYGEAITWLSRAQGVQSYLELSEIYEVGGYGVEKNISLAIEYIQKYINTTKTKDKKILNRMAYLHLNLGKKLLEDNIIEKNDKVNVVILENLR